MFWEFLFVLLTSAQPSSLKKHVAVKQHLSSLEELGAVDTHVAFTLVRSCGGFCKLTYLTHTTPPQRPLNFLMRMYVSALHNVLLWTLLIMPGTRLGLV